MPSTTFVDIILPLPLPGLYTYQVPEELSAQVMPGCRVMVQFGKRKIYSALIRKVHHTIPDYETKDILSLLDELPVVNEIQFTLWEWISGYYLCSNGEIMKAALPAGMKLESETNICFNESFEDYKNLNNKEEEICNLVASKGVMNISELSSVTKQKNLFPLIKILIDKGAVMASEKLKAGYKAKKVTYVSIHSSISKEKQLHDILDKLVRAPKQLELLLLFIKISETDNCFNQEIEKKVLFQDSSAAQSAFNTLVKKEIFEISEKEVSRLKSSSDKLDDVSNLNKDQQKALDELKDQYKEKDVALLHGVTSSGKTELYIHLIKEIVDKGQQILYLLPEIALTSQIITRLQKVFGNKVGIYHSKYSDNERFETWKNIISHSGFQIILGVRSSIFLPFDNLGLIIIDEEHENTYKQYDPAPRYHARDTAIVLATLHKAKVLLGTATPSMETYYNTKIDKYALVELNARYLDISMPKIHIADTREAYRKKQMQGHFTPVLLKSIEEALANNEQIILFQNRRGFSPYIECTLCGHIFQCNDCDVSLTYHKAFNNMVCHYCGSQQKVPSACPSCGSPAIETKGFGTEKIEDEITLFFPDSKVKRMDLDSTRSRRSYEKIISDFEKHKVDILIGTQMVSKGLDFADVSVVGILNADNMLNFPDFRAYERSYQLMAQVSGRAGRKHKQGKVIIQTSDPLNAVIKNVIENDYKKMFNQEMMDRKTFKYPPFFKLVKITLKHKDQYALNSAAKEFSDALRKVYGKRVIGPEFPLVSRIQNYYLKSIVIKIEREKSISKAKDLLKEELSNFLHNFEHKSFQVVIDVDPV